MPDSTRDAQGAVRLKGGPADGELRRFSTGPWFVEAVIVPNRSKRSKFSPKNKAVLHYYGLNGEYIGTEPPRVPFG